MFPSWWWAVIVGAAVASAVIPAGIMAADPGSNETLRVKGKGASTPSAPPGVAFSIIWPVLYLLAGGTLAYQGLTARTPIDWAGFALLALAIVLSWAWPVVFRTSIPASSWLILGILLVAVLGVVFWATGASGSSPKARNLGLGLGGVSAGPGPGPAVALWVPFLVWLVFALMLTVQTTTLETAATATASASASPGQTL